MTCNCPEVSAIVLLPIGSQHRRQRRGIGRRQGGLSGRRRRKRRHRVDQVLHLAVEQGLAVTGLELLHVVGVTQVPVRHRHLVRAADYAHLQTVSHLAEPHLVAADACRGVVLLDGVRSPAST